MTSRRAAQLGIFGLLASIIGFAVALIVTIYQADLHFRRGELSQAQFAAILRARSAVAANNGPAAQAQLDKYRSLTDIESRLPAENAREQAKERDVATELELLVPRMTQSAARAKIDEAIAFMMEREASEARFEQREMRELRNRTWWLTGALMAAAIGSAILGGIGLLLSNRRLASEVSRRTAEISAIDASRRLFFAKASHELRTPITVMRGEAEVAMSSPGEEIDALRQVFAQADFLERRVSELLALAQADDGHLQLNFTSCALGAVVADAIAAVQGYAASNGVRLLLEQVDPATISGDRRWLAQAIVAILDNAVKFSSEGDAVTLRVEGHDISIVDQGIGLMPQDVPRVFDAFYSTSQDSRGGSGLGLALARWVVTQHGGTIAAKNLDAGGCQIGIALPAAR